MTTNMTNMNVYEFSYVEEVSRSNMTTIPSLSLRSRIRCDIYYHYPIQLASQKSGFRTYDDFLWYLYESSKEFEEQEIEKMNQELEKYKIQLLIEEHKHMLELLNKQKEKIVKYDELPIESENFKKRREKSEKKMKEEAELFRKQCLEQYQASNPFGHRRNGGGKKGRRYMKQTAPEVIQAARASRKKLVKENNKREEETRNEKFKIQAPIIKTSVVKAPLLISDNEEEDDDNQIEYQIMSEKIKIMSEWEEKVKDTKEVILERKTATNTLKDIPQPPEANVGGWMTVNKREKTSVTVQDENISEPDVGGWETVNKKREKASASNVTHIVKDENMARQHLKLTKMCNSIMSGIECRHGKYCRFAHKPEELVISECFFGIKCRYVKCEKGVYCNTGGSKICSHKHPGESNINYYNRTK